VNENLVDDCRVLNTGYHPGFAAALLASRHIDVEDPLEALGPGHGPMALFGYLALIFLPCTTLATFGRCYINPIFVIWTMRRSDKHAMEAGQVYPRFGYQGCQLGNEIQRIEDDVSERRPVVPSL